MEDMQRIAKTSVSNRLKRMLANPPVRDGKPISKSRCVRASRGWMKAAMHKIKLREQKKKRRMEQETRRAEAGIHDDDDEITQAWKRQRKSSEAFGRHDDGTMKEGAGAQPAEPAYRPKKKTSLQRRKQAHRAKIRKDEALRANAIEDCRWGSSGSQPLPVDACGILKAKPKPMPRSQPDSGSQWRDRAGRDGDAMITGKTKATVAPPWRKQVERWPKQ